MAKAKRIQPKEGPSQDEFDEARKKVAEAVEMTESEFWKDGFKERRDAMKKFIKKHLDKANEGDMDEPENLKEAGIIFRDLKKVASEFWHYCGDIVRACDAYNSFIDEESMFENEKRVEFNKSSGKIKQ